MSVADTARRRSIPEQRRLISRERYLQACRDKGATTQVQRAELFGLKRQSVSRYETGDVEPLISTALWIAGRLDMTAEELWVAA